MSSLQNNNKQRILVLTPTFTGGSWIVIDELLSVLSDRKILCVGLGPIRANYSYKVISIPYFLFENLKTTYGSNIFFNLIYQIPLLILSIFQMIFFRPRVIISNGFTPILILLPFAKIFKVKTIVYYGSVIENKIKNSLSHKLFSSLNSLVDYVIANSNGSRIDLEKIINKNKIFVTEHWTKLEPLSDIQRKRIRSQLTLDKSLVVLFVGKLSFDKYTDLIIKVASLAKNDLDINFVFVGAGILKNKIVELTNKQRNVRYLGYSNNQEELRGYYSMSDITFSYADKTYLARPAIESLACGTPIMIPDRPAVLERMGKNDHIDENLVPKKIGWLVSPTNHLQIYKLFVQIKNNKEVLDNMRLEARKCATNKYSVKNIDKVIELLSPKR